MKGVILDTHTQNEAIPFRCIPPPTSFRLALPPLPQWDHWICNNRYFSPPLPPPPSLSSDITQTFLQKQCQPPLSPHQPPYPITERFISRLPTHPYSNHAQVVIPALSLVFATLEPPHEAPATSPYSNRQEIMTRNTTFALNYLAVKSLLRYFHDYWERSVELLYTTKLTFVLGTALQFICWVASASVGSRSVLQPNTASCYT